MTDIFDGGDGIDTAIVLGRAPADAPLTFALDLTVLDAGEDLHLPLGGIVRANVEHISFSFTETFASPPGLVITNRDRWEVIGSSRDDIVAASGGNAVLEGRQGSDRLFGWIGDDLIDGGDGDDFLDGSAGSDHLIGGAGADHIVGFSSSTPYPINLWRDTLEGGAGNDTIYASLGSDVDGGGDADELIFHLYADATTFLDLRGITLDAGVYSGVSSGRIGETGPMVEGAVTSVESLRVTFDLFQSPNGRLILQGRAFADNVSGSNGADVLFGNDGGDILSAKGGDDHVEGGAGDDSILGEAGDDLLVGGAGADTLNGGDGVDTADYSTSNGRVVVRLSTGLGESAHAQGDALTLIENLTGSAFNDALIGGTGANALSGGLGADYLDGGAADDVLTGGDGDDRLVGGIGADQLIGGAGIDLADYSTGTGRVVARLWNGTGQEGAAQGDTLAGVENVTGTTANDSLIGSTDANVLRGGAGADYLDGLEGNDILVGGAGADNMVGGAGIDTVSYEDATARVVIRISNQTAAEGEAAGDTISGFENATGGAGNDALIGDGIANNLDGRAGNDYLDGASGNDILIGGLGDDRLVGGAGADQMNGGDGIDLADYSSSTTRVVVRLSTGLGESNHAQGDTLTNIENLTGGSGNDSLIGANLIANALRGGGGDDYLDGLSGNDYLDGGAGVDRLNGGADADTFAFIAGQGNGDQVFDFVSGQDTMRFEGYGAGATLTQLDATHWRIASADGLTADIITLTNSAIIAPGDVLFV